MTAQVERSGPNPFTFDLEAARAQYEAAGWFHAPSGAAPRLMEHLTEQVAVMLGTGAGELGAWRYPEKKSQFLYEPQDETELGLICRSVAEATGMDPERTLVSERHLKVYSSTAPELPPAHKDRSASKVTVGIGVDIPPDSQLVMWPDVDATYNPYPTSAEWRETRHPDELPEQITHGREPTRIDLRRGDVVMFRGAEIYHERYKPANTAVLYLKFNDLGLDPLGEDPRTVFAERRTRGIRSAGIDDGTMIELSPRMIGLRTDELFPDLGVVTYARTIEDERAVRLTTAEAELLRHLATGCGVTLGRCGLDPATVDRMAASGLITLRGSD